MMVVGLLLAQLVLPGPPSGPIQPPGMICLGECAGPVVWGPAERGRLVVACDMRSDTCSDGRKITTTRATPVPCEVAPGVWEMVGVDEGCYSVRGLESWAANTSYLSYGAELDRSPWGKHTSTTVENRGAWYRIHGTGGSSYLQQQVPAVAGETWTASCIMRAGTSSRVGLSSLSNATGGSILDMDLTSEWRTYSRTLVATANGSAGVYLYPTRAGAGYIEVAGCWLTKTNTPGRPCWGGEAPVTCAADLHTISTEGWPTEAGEISVAFTVPAAGVSDDARIILDGRGGGGSGYLRVSSSNNLQLVGGTPTIITIANTPPREEPYNLRLSVSSGVMRVWLDGAELAPRESVFPAWGSEATLGSGYLNAQHLNGSIRSLTVRSYE